MQTKYEQITELRETATLINQLEFKIQLNEDSLKQLERFNSHKENTDLINELTAITDKLKTDLQKHKEVFDLLLSNIKPYQSKEVERELKVGDVLVSNGKTWLYPTKGDEYTIVEVNNKEGIIRLKQDITQVWTICFSITKVGAFYYKDYFTLKS